MTPRKILILGPAWVGDMVLAQSLFKTLKTNRPDCIIDVAAPTWTLPLLEAWVGFKPYTPLNEGVEKFVNWYRQFYRI